MIVVLLSSIFFSTRAAFQDSQCKMILICLFGALELKQPLCLSSSSFKAKYFSLVAPHRQGLKVNKTSVPAMTPLAISPLLKSYRLK